MEETPRSPKSWWPVITLFGVVLIATPHNAPAAETIPVELERAFPVDVTPLLKRLCHECHSEKLAEADIDLTAFTTLAEVRKHPQVWQKVGEMLESGQMPPKDATQPTDAERMRLQQWVKGYLTAEARTRAGDPGRVVLRRLNNAEYTYTLRDLTGVPTLDPTREFPVDGAAGEGFTNVGQSLVMSPALVTKYLDAAKEVAQHAMLTPMGFRFSPHTTSQDWTNDTLDEIRTFYRQYSAAAGADKVNLQGIVFDTNQGGRLPVEKYLSVLLTERQALRSGKSSFDDLAKTHNLSPKYLRNLWTMLETAPDATQPTLLLDALRRRWQAAKPEEAQVITQEIAQWQQSLWRFTTVGHIGKVDGPKAWMEPVSPLAARQEIRRKLTAPPNAKEVTLYLAVGDAGDGHGGDFAVWERPRIVAPGRPDLMLRDVRAVTKELTTRRDRFTASAAACLAAAAEAGSPTETLSVADLARKHSVDADSLTAWLDYLGIGAASPVSLGTPITRKMESGSGYDFIKGWVGDDALSVVANSSAQHVRIPGNMKPHSVAVHPTPTLSVCIGWKAPVNTAVKIEGVVQHAHPECGNGVAWTVEVRRGNTRQILATGISHGAKPVPYGPFENVAVKTGDVVVLIISPRDNNHSCDLTAVDMSLTDGTRNWSLAGDISPQILAGNPHADALGNAAVWHFFSQPATGVGGHVIPVGSLLARWQSAASAEQKQSLAIELQKLLRDGPGSLPAEAPDVALHRQLTSFGGPLLSAALPAALKASANADLNDASPVGLAPKLFGPQPRADVNSSVDEHSLFVQAPSVLEFRLPADLVEGAEFVTAGTLHPSAGGEGSVQLQLLTEKPTTLTGLQPSTLAETNKNGPWTSNNRDITFSGPVIAAENSPARKRLETTFDDFRQWFPAALCYTKIVPVDEVVTLTLFYREDDHLSRLMFNDVQAAELNRLWNELHYFSRDALTLVDALEQLIQYATQDANPKVFEPLREPFAARAAAFRKQLVDSEPAHLHALMEFADRAYRRPLSDTEANDLRSLYARLRQQELPHEDAFRLTLARVLVSPAFLYHLEKPVPGATQGKIHDVELASRLSYFLWSSMPDEALLTVAETGALGSDAELKQQSARMLQDPKARRFATEFAGQWLHIHGFEHHDEKSERHFPTFAALRGAMAEEATLVFLDLLQTNGSVLSLIESDSTFLNEDLAKHYGIPNVTGPEWRRVDGVKQHSRGGILTWGATLSTQAGASRTSPILRGNWLSEVVLGEKLPRPPKNVPQLSDTVPEGLTERQLIERHSSDPLCVKCHQRIDPFGFALENFDAIGRYREKDAAGLAIDSRTQLADGTKMDGLAGLQTYLLNTRRDAFLRQFCKKLLGYALARSVQLSDEPLLTEMQSNLKANDYRIGAAIETVILSRPFREIRGREVASEE